MNPEELRLFIERELVTISDKAVTAKLPAITDAVIVAQNKLKDKLKLAVVGKTKAGKSTLLNSLLGITELPTGDGIVTGNVSVLMHINDSPSHEESVVVHLIGGTTKNISFEQYRQLVDISKEDSWGIRNQIIWFDVYLRHQALLDMSIIDTPGDDSWLKYDSENAKALFRDKNRRPDIIAYVARKEFGIKDIQAAHDYLVQINGGQNRVSGLNVVAIYSCCDELIASDIDGCNWDLDYRIEGNRIIENNRMKSSAFRLIFSKSFPVSAIFSTASILITKDDFIILKKISTCSTSEYFYKDISYIEYEDMSIEYPDLFQLFNNEEQKNDMIKRLGLDVMKYIVWWLTKNPSGTMNSLKEDLEDYSNIPALRKYLLEEHFKKISLFYKATSILPELKNTVESEYNKSVDIDEIENLKDILNICMNIEKRIYTHYGFLSVLRDYYDRKNYFNEDEWTLAIDTIKYSVSDNNDINENRKYRHFWEKKMIECQMVGNYLAKEASEKLMKSVTFN